eukprot:CAMPEP_0170530410 /NCGR_PEP_ID=MMETSP0209-20121228/47056_1 /TAXON_ID=665100 ORGANISM="Litonotus pictus, Strain P1" /NCGR_SAMPLE_ID=MMETSP0209 /ASSEMBLY_ACC=CAM_ASM_000301 /LENGTH=209 /DNA_ID=CAMNT_0010823501 /DNA_START=301 /DNA_END=930 /DNA_ORIENTATION=+
MEFDDYHIDYWIYFVQCFMWCLISSLMKVLTYLIMIIFSFNLEAFGTFLLEDLDKYPRFELVVVMIIVPFILNAFQFWIIDSFLKESDESRISRMAKGQALLAQVRWEDYVKKVSNNEIKLNEDEMKLFRKGLEENNQHIRSRPSCPNTTTFMKSKHGGEGPFSKTGGGFTFNKAKGSQVIEEGEDKGKKEEYEGGEGIQKSKSNLPGS